MDDLRQRPNWTPLRSTTVVGPHVVHSWNEPRLPGEPYRDLTGITHTRNTLRVIVIDPVLVTDLGTPQEVDRATATMTGALMELLRLPEDVTTLLDHAVDTFAHSNWSGPAACVGVIELWEDHLTAWRHGDIQVWVNTPTLDTPQNLFPTDMLTPDARQAIDNRNPEAPEMAEQRRLLSDARSWRTAPIGLPHAPRQTAQARHVQRAIMSTDGVPLTPERATNHWEYLSGEAQLTPPDWHHPSPHGDIALIELLPKSRDAHSPWPPR